MKAPAAPVPMRAPATVAPVPMRAPAPVAPVAPVAPANASMGSLVKGGFAWGLGNGMAHTLVFRPAAAPSAKGSPEYVQCMKDFEDHASICYQRNKQRMA